jgi:colanic acid/amylovoran biosynthesis protein
MGVLILNTCSTLNRGDAAIVLGQIQLLREHFPDARITLTSKTPARDRGFYGPMGIEVLPPLMPALSTYDGFKGKLVGGTRTMFALREKRELLQAFRDADLVLACGGGYLYSYRSLLPGTTFWQNIVHARLALVLGKPLVFLPQSFGPFASSLAQGGVKRLLEAPRVVKIYAREEVSFQLVRRLLRPEQQAKVALCPDMALYLARDNDESSLAGDALDLPRPILVVNLREWGFPEAGSPAASRWKREQYLDAFGRVARFFVERYKGSAVVVPQALGPDPAEDDRPVCREFCRLAAERIAVRGAVQYLEPDTSSLCGFMAILSQATLLLGTRLHSCLLGLVAGVPAISVGYQHKSQGTLDLLGMGRFNANIDGVSADRLIGLVEEVMSCREEIQAVVRSRLRQAVDRIEAEVGELFAYWEQAGREAVTVQDKSA